MATALLRQDQTNGRTHLKASHNSDGRNKPFLTLQLEDTALNGKGDVITTHYLLAYLQVPTGLPAGVDAVAYNGPWAHE